MQVAIQPSPASSQSALLRDELSNMSDHIQRLDRRLEELCASRSLMHSTSHNDDQVRDIDAYIPPGSNNPVIYNINVNDVKEYIINNGLLPSNYHNGIKGLWSDLLFWARTSAKNTIDKMINQDASSPITFGKMPAETIARQVKFIEDMAAEHGVYINRVKDQWLAHYMLCKGWNNNTSAKGKVQHKY
ncbi:hypothetical protein H4219_004781 [Mycoemilia scoparia]|uniref:Uncharacterized protein n=1 Tax=Mycoemilia scoparia TaxID=417184 RepID=A0A9W8DQK3_9FUNG|nr:hypothetical protein H4219_004781 [Mycoemilia scoparia]